MSPPRPRRWWPWVLGLAVAAVLGISGSMAMFAGWTETTAASPEEARAAFEEALAGPASGEPYLTVDGGDVHVNRGLEAEEQDVDVLVLLAWEPARESLVRVRFPFWFVRAKSTRHVNLGTLTAFLAEDWDHLDLSVTEEDLARRGPGLVLDVTREDGAGGDGARLMLWLE